MALQTLVKGKKGLLCLAGDKCPPLTKHPLYNGFRGTEWQSLSSASEPSATGQKYL